MHLGLFSELHVSQFGNEPKPTEMTFLSILLGEVQVVLKLVLAQHVKSF